MEPSSHKLNKSTKCIDELLGHSRDVHVSDEVQQVSAGRALVQVLGRQHQLRRQADDLLQQEARVRPFSRKHHPRLSGEPDVCRFDDAIGR